MDVHTLITASQFEQASAQFGPCELVRGEVTPLSPGGILHSQTTAKVTVLLAKWAEQTGLGRVLAGEVGLIVERDPDTVRGADVAFYSYQRLPKDNKTDAFCAVPPELVVEVLGKGQGWRDMVAKAADYLRMGVDRVWIIDPRSQQMHIYGPEVAPVILDADDMLVDPVLPGFSCKVSDFFS